MRTSPQTCPRRLVNDRASVSQVPRPQRDRADPDGPAEGVAEGAAIIVEDVIRAARPMRSHRAYQLLHLAVYNGVAWTRGAKG